MAFPLITDIILIILLLFFCKTRVRIRYLDTLIFTVEILLFAVTFKFGEKKKRNRRKTFKRRLKNTFALTRALNSLFEHSKIYVNELNVSPKTDSPSDFVIKKQNYMTLISLFLSYIYSKSEILVLNTDNEQVVSANRSKISFDAIIDAPLYSLFLSLFIYKMSKRWYKYIG